MTANAPATIWRTTDGLTDFDNEGFNYIVDSLGDFLVDPTGDFVVDTGVVANLIPATIWEEDNSI